MATPHDEKPPLFTCPRCGELYDAETLPKGESFNRDPFRVDVGDGVAISTCAECPQPEAETPATIARLLAYCRAESEHRVEGRRRHGAKLMTRLYTRYHALCAEAQALPAPPATRAAAPEYLIVLRAERTESEVPRA